MKCAKAVAIIVLTTILIACSSSQVVPGSEQVAPRPEISDALSKASGVLVSSGAKQDTVYLYQPPFPQAVSLVHPGGRGGFSGEAYVDRSGNLFVSAMTAGSPIREYAQPYTRPPSLIATPRDSAAQLILERPNGLLFVASNALTTHGFVGAVLIYTKPYAERAKRPAAITLPAGTQAADIAFDRADDMFVLACCTQAKSTLVLEYSPPYTGSPTVRAAIPTIGRRLYLGPTGDLLVFGTSQTSNGASFYQIAPPYTSKPLRVLVFPKAPRATAVDSQGQILVAIGHDVLIYPPPYRTASATIKLGASPLIYPAQMAFDGQDNLFVLLQKYAHFTPPASGQGFQILKYSPPYRRVAWKSKMRLALTAPPSSFEVDIPLSK